MKRTEINVRNGHHLLGEYIARWWKCNQMWQWEVVPVENESSCFEIEENKKEYFDEEFEGTHFIGENGRSELYEYGGQDIFQCDARAKALGYALSCNAKDGKKIQAGVPALIPSLKKLDQAVADFRLEVGIHLGKW